MHLQPCLFLLFFFKDNYLELAYYISTMSIYGYFFCLISLVYYLLSYCLISFPTIVLLSYCLTSWLLSYCLMSYPLLAYYLMSRLLPLAIVFQLLPCCCCISGPLHKLEGGGGGYKILIVIYKIVNQANLIFLCF